VGGLNPFAEDTPAEMPEEGGHGGDHTLIMDVAFPGSPGMFAQGMDDFTDGFAGDDPEPGATDQGDTLLMDLGERRSPNWAEPAAEPGLFSFQTTPTAYDDDPLTGGSSRSQVDNTDALSVVSPAQTQVTRPGLKNTPAPTPNVVVPMAPMRKPAGGGFTKSLATGAVVVVLAGVAACAVPKPWGAVLAAVLGGGAAVALGGGGGGVKSQRVRQFSEELRLSCEALGRGEFQSSLSVVGQDDFAEAALAFNQMLTQIRERFKELQDKAEEVERSREDLQRQVIRLLDDVEGAARGDLTVQAEVSADILGAVADSFNLIIQNIRQIVQQVKTSTLQVGRAATDSEFSQLFLAFFRACYPPHATECHRWESTKALGSSNRTTAPSARSHSPCTRDLPWAKSSPLKGGRNCRGSRNSAPTTRSIANPQVTP